MVGCGCDNEDAPPHEHLCSMAWTLNLQVDAPRLLCLNERRPDSLKDVLRPWEKRLDTDLPTLQSDVDEQLLLCIPFVSPVKIMAISVVGAGGACSPARMSAFINNEVMDFASAESARPVQSWDLAQHNPDGLVEYPTRYSKFQNVSKLWLFVSANYGADSTTILYLGLKGMFTTYKREAVNAVYEARPLKAAEDVKDPNNMPRNVH